MGNFGCPVSLTGISGQHKSFLRLLFLSLCLSPTLSVGLFHCVVLRIFCVFSIKDPEVPVHVLAFTKFKRLRLYAKLNLMPKPKSCFPFFPFPFSVFPNQQVSFVWIGGGMDTNNLMRRLSKSKPTKTKQLFYLLLFICRQGHKGTDSCGKRFLLLTWCQSSPDQLRCPSIVAATASSNWQQCQWKWWQWRQCHNWGQRGSVLSN